MHSGSDDPVVAFRAAALTFGDRELWRDLDLEIRPGEFLAVLGPNGTGKTTLLRAILGLQPLSGGTLEVFGQPPKRGNAGIGYIPQQRLIAAATPVRGADLIGFGVSGTRLGLPLPRRADRRRVRELVHEVGADAFANRPAALLSGGEQQRIRVGQALADSPGLLLCDEPLISLDLAHQRGVSSLIDRHRRERNAAVVFVTHDVNPVLDIVDRVLYLAGGRFRIGTPAEVLRSAVLTDLYGTHVDVVRVHDRVVVIGGTDAHAEDEHAHSSSKAAGA